MPTPDLNQQIQALLAEYTTKLTALVREATVGAVLGALSVADPSRKTAPTRSHAPAPTSPNKRQNRRGPDAIKKDAAEVLNVIRSNPGKRSEEVRAALGMDRGPFLRAITQLVAAKKITKKGEKRKTTYTAT